MLLRPAQNGEALVPLLDLHQVGLVGDSGLHLLVLYCVLDAPKQDDPLVGTAVAHHRDARVADVIQALRSHGVLHLQPHLLVQ